MALEVQLSPGDSDFISSEWLCGNESGEFCVKVLVLSLRFSLLSSIMTIPGSVPSSGAGGQFDFYILANTCYFCKFLTIV